MDSTTKFVKEQHILFPGFFKYLEHYGMISKFRESVRQKEETQEAHFSGKHLTLHCSIIEPNVPAYIYHFSHDTSHDSIFVHHVLTDIKTSGKIRNKLIFMNDNASTQYKNKQVFRSMQNLAATYNLCIFRLYGAAEHGKGLIHAMSSLSEGNFTARCHIRQVVCRHTRDMPLYD